MKNQQTRDKSSFLSSNVMKVSSHFTVDICVFPLQTWGGGEEETHLPCSRLRKDIQENISAPGSRPIAHRRAAVCLQLGFLREAFHAQRRVAAARSDAHRWPRTFVWTRPFKKPQYTHVCFVSRYRWQTLRVQPVSETLHEERSPDEAL